MSHQVRQEAAIKILITGDKGFVGTETKKLLKPEQVIGYDIMDGRDIRDYKQLEYIVNENGPDRILHLAAVARFADCDKDPMLALQTNILGTANIAKIAMKYHIPVVYSSTGSAMMPLDSYEPPYDESIPARGNSIYGVSKALGEKLIEFAKPYITLRYAHLYGKEKRMHGLIGGYLDRIQRGMKPKLYGGQQSNDFTYIKDVAEANVLALMAPWDKWNQIYNIGSGEELSAEEAGNYVCEAADYDGGVEKVEARTVDASRFVFDISKAKTMLGYEPKYTFKEGLKDMFSNE